MSKAARMDDVQWPKALNHVITKRWTQLKNSLVMRDFVDHLIQRKVVTLDYWMGLKSKPVSESERTEDFLSLVLKFDQNKFNHFLEALIIIDRKDLARQLMKCQEGKQTSGSGKSNNSEKSQTKPRSSSSKASGVARTDLNAGQGDSDQLPSAFSPRFKQDKLPDASDGHNGSFESNKRIWKNPDISNSSDLHGRKPEVKQPAGKLNSNTLTKNNPQSVSTATRSRSNDEAKISTVARSAISPDRKQTKTKDNPLTPQTPSLPNSNNENKTANKTDQMPGLIDERKIPNDEILGTKTMLDDPRTKDDQKKEELIRTEELLKIKESELNQRELKLREQEKKLKDKEIELFTRENSLLSRMNSEIQPPASTMPFQAYQQDNSNPPTASSTQSTDVFAEVRDQLAELKKEREIDSELTTRLGFNKDDFVKADELQSVQQEVMVLREEIATDRTQRENLHHKVEGLKQEIETLQTTIQTLKLEKETDTTQLNKEVIKLTTDLKNAKLSYNDAITKLRQDMKAKDNENEKLKSKIDDAKKESVALDKRVLLLENEKERFEMAVLQHEKDVAELKKTLEEKETQMFDLRKALDDTEDEKEDLVEEIGKLKTEMARLKAERKRLESEKKTLLGRCVKPGWSTSRRPSLNK